MGEKTPMWDPKTPLDPPDPKVKCRRGNPKKPGLICDPGPKTSEVNPFKNSRTQNVGRTNRLLKDMCPQKIKGLTRGKKEIVPHTFLWPLKKR